MTLTSKFKKDLQTLRGAADGDYFLDVKNPKLYKKIRRYYQNEGVDFSGDPLDLIGAGSDQDGERNDYLCSDGIDNDNDGKIDGRSEIWSTSNSGTVISLNYRF